MNDQADQMEADPLGLFDEASGNLTMKQRLFAQAYVDNGGNGTQAAITAGYSEDYADRRGSENVRKSEVMAEIRRRYDLRVSASGATADYALSELKVNLEAAKENGRYSDVNKAAELIGKYHKLFTDKLELAGEVALKPITSNDSDEEAARKYQDNLKATRGN